MGSDMADVDPYARRVAAVLHYWMEEAMLPYSALVEEGRFEEIPVLVDTLFQSNMKTRKASLTLQERGMDDAKQAQSKATPKKTASSLSSLTSGLSASSPPRNPQRTQTSNERIQRLFSNELAGESPKHKSSVISRGQKGTEIASAPKKGPPINMTPLVEMLADFSLQMVSDNKFHQKYTSEMEHLQFDEKEMDMDVLETLRSSGIHMQWISEELAKRSSSDLIDKYMDQYITRISSILDAFDDNKGSFFLGKLKIHFVFWRTLFTQSYVQLPFLNIMDSIIVFLMHLGEYAWTPSQPLLPPSQDPVYKEALSANPEIVDDFGTIGRSVRNTVFNVKEHRKKQTARKSVWDPSFSPLYIQRQQSMSAHFISALALILIAAGGIGLVWFIWQDTAESVILSSVNDLNLVLNDAGSQGVFELDEDPKVALTTLHVSFPVDTDVFVTDDIASTETYFAKMRDAFNIHSVYVGTNDGLFFGAFAPTTSETSSNYFLMVNATGGCAYRSSYTLDDGQLVAKEYQDNPTCNLDIVNTPWYTRAEAFTVPDADTVVRGWTGIRALSSGPLFGDYGLSYVSPVVNGSLDTVAVYGLDVTTDLIATESAHHLITSDMLGAVFVADRTTGDLYAVLESNQDQNQVTWSTATSSVQPLIKLAADKLVSQFGSFADIETTSSTYDDEENRVSIAVTNQTSSEGYDLLVISVVDYTDQADGLQVYTATSALVALLTVLAAALFSCQSFLLLNPTFSFGALFGRSVEVLPPRIVELAPVEKQSAPLTTDKYNSFEAASEHVFSKVASSEDIYWAGDQDTVEHKPGIVTRFFVRGFDLINAALGGCLGGLVTATKRAHSSYKRIYSIIQDASIRYGITTVFLGTVLVWFIWSTASNVSLKSVSQRYLEQNVENVVAEVSNFFQDSQTVNSLNELLLVSGAWNNASDLVDLDSRDRSMVNTMNQFTNDDGSFILQSTFIGYPDGTFAGSERLSDSSLLLLAKDYSTGDCFTKYTVEDDKTRNSSDVQFESPGCLYDPREQEWYTAAVAKESQVWGDVFVIDAERLGLILSKPIYDDGNALVAVVGATVNLAGLTAYLKSVDLSDTSSRDKIDTVIQPSKQFIMTPSFETVGSSHSALTSGEEELGVADVRLATDANVSLTATAIELYGVESFSLGSTFEMDRSFEDPLTFIQNISDPSSELFLLAVVTVPREAYFGELIDSQAITFPACAATIAVVFYISTMGFKRVVPTTKSVEEVDDLDFDEEEDIMVKDENQEIIRVATDPTKLDYWRRQLDTIVKKDLLKHWVHKLSSTPCYAPVPSRDFSNVCIERAEQHVKTSEQSRDIIFSVLLHSLHDHPRVYAMYRFSRSIVWRILVFFCFFVVHLLLSSPKENTPRLLAQKGTPVWIVLTEGIVILIEVTEALFRLVVLLTLLKSHNNTYRFVLGFEREVEDEHLASTVGAYLHSKYRKQLKRVTTILILLSAVLLDWVLILSNRWSIEYYLPIRVLIPLLMDRNVRDVARGFWRTVRGAKNEFVLYLSCLLFSAVTGSVLFRVSINPNQVENSFSNIIRSVTTSFIFFSTQENYTDLVFDAFEENPAYVLYFLSVTIIGTFVLLAFVLSSFVNGFTREFQTEVLKKKQYSRTGMLSAYLLLDMDQNNQIPNKTLKDFFNHLWPDESPESEPDIGKQRKKRKRRREFMRDCQTLEGFVTAMEDLVEERRVQNYNERYFGHKLDLATTMPVGVQSQITVQDVEERLEETMDPQVERVRQRKQRMMAVLGSGWFSQIVAFVVVCQTFLLTFYGLSDDQLLDTVNVFFIVLYFCEISAKVYAYGLSAYLTPTLYVFENQTHLNRPEYQVANRVDFFAVGMSCIAVTIGVAISGKLDFTGRESLRFGMTFAVLRIFTQVSTTRRLIYPIMMGTVLKQFLYLFVLMLLVMYVFAMWGMLLFHGKFVDYVLQDSLPRGNFDSLAKSFIMLFQMLVGEDWQNIMYAGIKVWGDFTVAWYFIFYIVIMTLFFSNIFVSLVLAIMEKFGNDSDLTKREFEQRMIDDRK